MTKNRSLNHIPKTHTIKKNALKKSAILFILEAIKNSKKPRHEKLKIS